MASEAGQEEERIRNNDLELLIQELENIKQGVSPELVISVVGDGIEFVPKIWPTHRFRKALIHILETFITGTWILYARQHTCRIQNTVIETLKECQISHGPKKVKFICFLNRNEVQDTDSNSSNFKETEEMVHEERVKDANESLSEVEGNISKYFVRCHDDEIEIKLPVVMFVVEGDIPTITRVAKAIEQNIPVVLIKGTGMASDLLYYCLNTEEALTIQAALQFGICFSESNWKDLEDSIARIKKKSWLVSTFDVENDDPEKLAKVTVEIILRNWALLNAVVGKEEENQKKTVISDECIAHYAVKRVSQNQDKTDIKSEYGTNDSDNITGGDTGTCGGKCYSCRCCCYDEKKLLSNQKHASAMSSLEIYLMYQALQNPKGPFKEEEFRNKMYSKLLNEALAADNHVIVAVLVEIRAINKFKIEYKTLYEKTDERLKSILKVDRWCKDGDQSNHAERAAERARNLLRFTKPIPSGHLNYGDTSNNGDVKNNTRQTFLHLLLWAILTNKRKLAEVIWKKSPHPIVTALIASALLRKLSRKVLYKNHSVLSEDLASHSKIFCQRAMNVADGIYAKNPDIAINSLIQTEPVIWGISTSCTDFAQKYRIYDFVVHHVAQKSYNSVWYGSPLKDTAKSVYCVRICNEDEKFLPYICGALKAPVTRFYLYYIINNIFGITRRQQGQVTVKPLNAVVNKPGYLIEASFLAFLVCLSVFVLSNLDVQITDWPRCAYEIITYIWIIGDFIEEYAPALFGCFHCDSEYPPKRCGMCKSCLSSKYLTCFQCIPSKLREIRVHFRDLWNVLDGVGYIMMLLSVIFRYSDAHNGTTRLLFSITMYIMYMRFLHVLLLSRNIGPTIIMLKEALKDLLRFLVVLGVFVASTGVFYHANLYPNHYDLFSSFGISYWSFWRIVYLPFWAVFGEFEEELDGVGESGCSFNESIYVHNADVERCPEKNWWVSVMSGIYTTLVNLLLVNLVIAMFSFRFEEIKENSMKYWLYHRSKIILEFENRFPSPLNIFYWMYRLCFCWKCQCKDHTKIKPNDLHKAQKIVARQWENQCQI